MYKNEDRKHAHARMEERNQTKEEMQKSFV